MFRACEGGVSRSAVALEENLDKNGEFLKIYMQLRTFAPIPCCF